MNDMHTAYLLIGGNMGNREEYLSRAAQLIEARCGDIIALSHIYETEAWGFTDQPAFLNQVAVLQTTLPPDELMQLLLGIEQELGRVRTQKLGPRTIDIDILLIDDLVQQSPLLTLPHPAMPQRRFVLVPLAEVAGQLMHPVLHKTIDELLTDCPDKLAVKKFS